MYLVEYTKFKMKNSLEKFRIFELVTLWKMNLEVYFLGIVPFIT